MTDAPKPYLDALKKYVAGTPAADAKLPMIFPPTIAKTLGFDLVAVELGTAVTEIKARVDAHANPMGTIHGGVMVDVADAAIGIAHATTLGPGESFTTVDLKINFFRPAWDGTLRASAAPVQSGRTLSYYECRITDEKARLMAVVTSSVMTLRGDAAKGR